MGVYGMDVCIRVELVVLRVSRIFRSGEFESNLFVPSIGKKKKKKKKSLQACLRKIHLVWYYSTIIFHLFFFFFFLSFCSDLID